MRFIGAIALFFFSVVSFAAPKNIILFIGDGMGPSWVTAARFEKLSRSKTGLAMDQLPHTAIVRTHSADGIVTDSAAAATAMASGVKTKNKVIGQDASGKSVATLAEMAKKKGMSVGIVTNTRITHATPAAFYAHIHSRNEEKAIAKQMLASDFDLFLGGGLKHFELDALKSHKRFKFIQKRSALKQNPKLPVIGLFAKSHLTYMKDRMSKHKEEPTLSELTRYSIQKLVKNPKGFFLMVEGGRIDHAGHENLAAHGIEETLEFDRAIGTAMKEIRKNKTLTEANTVVVVTADHETGGLAINGYIPHKETVLNRKVANVDKATGEKALYPVLTFSTGPDACETPKGMPYAAHTGVDVHGYGWGRGVETLKGTLDNTDIFKVLNIFLREKVTQLSQAQNR